MDNQSLERSYKRQKIVKLFISIFVDAIGLVSYFFPGLGENSDLAWAPVASVINYLLFKGKIGVFGGGITFLEEVLPFTDFIPSVTLSWMMKYWINNEKSYKEFVKKHQSNEEN